MVPQFSEIGEASQTSAGGGRLERHGKQPWRPSALCRFPPVLVALLALTGLAFCGSPDAMSGAESVSARLRAPLRVNWQATPLPRALQRLEATQHLPIWVDRRIPLDRLVDLSTPATTVDAVLRALAQQQDAEICRIGTIIYFGPPATATQLPQQYQQLRAQIGRLPQGRRRAWLDNRTISWSTPAEPSTLVSTWNQQYGLELQDLTRIPHDLWSERTYSSVTLAEITTLTLAGFQLGIEIGEDGQAKVVPLPERTADSGAATSAAARARSSTASGPAERSTAKRRVKNLPLSRQRFTLTVRNQPLGAVLDAVRAQSDLDVVWPENEEALQQRLVSVEVHDAPVEDLLGALFADLPASYELQGRTLKIRHQD